MHTNKPLRKGDTKKPPTRTKVQSAETLDPICRAADLLRARIDAARPEPRRSKIMQREATRLLAETWPELFLEAFKQCGIVSVAAKVAGIDRSTAIRRRQSDADFARRWKAAKEEAADALEVEARRRALDGWEEPVFQGGERVGVIRRYDSKLLQLLLQATRPKKFRQRREVFHKKEALAVIPGDREGMYSAILARMSRNER